MELKAVEAYTRDVGRGLIRIDYATMDELELVTGEPVRVTANGKTTVLKALPLYPSDEDKKIARIEGVVRTNIKVKIEEMISIEKIKQVNCVSVSVEPLEAIPPIDERYLVECLESSYLSENNQFIVPYFGGKLTFKTLSVIPNESLITNSTVFTITDKSNNVNHKKYQTNKKAEWINNMMVMINDVKLEDGIDQIQLTLFLNEMWDKARK